jgi:3-hydroxymyristoyl/3-hydroxydecanoyl-(acyl carrier protein) dehydratase
MIGEIAGCKEIMATLPYRYPMLMLDRVSQQSETKFIGIFPITPLCQEFYR